MFNHLSLKVKLLKSTADVYNLILYFLSWVSVTQKAESDCRSLYDKLEWNVKAYNG